MARRTRLCPAGIPQHIIQRGNNRQRCFLDATDFATFANCLAEYSTHYEVAIHAWVFMDNHVHLLVTPMHDDAVSGMMQAVGRRYVRYFNDRYKRTGTLWEGRYRSCLVQKSDYFLACQRYIELNPVRARMVAFPVEYHWSSYQCNALGTPSNLCTPHDEYLLLGSNDFERMENYRRLFAGDSEIPDDYISRTVNTGSVLGDEQFHRFARDQFGMTFMRSVATRVAACG